MARIIKARPETAELVSGANAKRPEEALLVSWESLEKKKTELDELIRVRIPQNTKDISIARSYGDLRENFEYKSAKDLQKYLMHRKNELEKDITRARGTDFKGSDASKVNIGTIVTLTDCDRCGGRNDRARRMGFRSPRKDSFPIYRKSARLSSAASRAKPCRSATRPPRPCKLSPSNPSGLSIREESVRSDGCSPICRILLNPSHIPLFS